MIFQRRADTVKIFLRFFWAKQSSEKAEKPFQRKLNHDNTELLVIHSKFCSRPFLNCIFLGDDSIPPVEHARNLTVKFGQCFGFRELVKFICRIKTKRLFK